MPGWQVFPAQVHHCLVQVNHDHFLNTWMSEDLPKSSSFTTTCNEYASGLLVTEHGRVDERFVVDKFIGLCRLNFPVQDQTPSERARFHNSHLLKRRSVTDDLFRVLDPEA
jgi:hypothetical protein